VKASENVDLVVLGRITTFIILLKENLVLLHLEFKSIGSVRLFDDTEISRTIPFDDT
jgi:hypothetical protein